MISRSSQRDILPLTAFEEYMFLDDRPGYPMSILVRLRFDRVVDANLLRGAFELALARHPLLRATVGRDLRHSWVWVVGPPPPTPFWYLGEVPTDAFPSSARYLDLRSQVGIRGWLADYQSGSLLFVQAHHACCDGLGLASFLRDVLEIYAASRGAGPTSLPVFDDEHLQARGYFGMTPLQLLRSSRRQIAEAARNRHYFLREPATLMPETAAEPTEHAGSPSLWSASLSPEETAALKTTATNAGVTTNDLLIRDLYVSIATWRAELRAHHNAQVPEANEWLRLLIPMNLRRPEDELTSAANIVGMVFLDRRLLDVDNPTRLLRGIGCEMQLIKRYQLAQLFVLSLLIGRRSAGGIQRIISGDHCCATTLLSNLGDPLKHSTLPREDGLLVVGDTRVTSFELAAPIRRRTHAAVAVNFYGGRLTVTVQSDPAVVPPQAAQLLLDSFLRQVGHTAVADDALA